MKKDKNPEEIEDNVNFRNSWTLDAAVRVMEHPTVDSKIWAEAVEWLMLYGPENIRELLLSASDYATNKQFPQIKAAGCTINGEVCYNIEDIARVLDIGVEEARKILADKEKSHDKRHGFTDSETREIQ